MRAKIVFVAVVFITMLSAQENPYHNPDGYIGGYSIHFTPMIWSHSRDLKDFQEEKYAETTASGKFSFDLLLKIPMRETFTLSFFYSRRNLDEEYNLLTPIKLRETAQGKGHIFGATLSFYFY